MLTPQQKNHLYEVACKHLTAKDAASLVFELNEIVGERFTGQQNQLLTKADLEKFSFKFDGILSQWKRDMRRWLFFIFFILALLLIGLYFKG